MEKYLLRRSQIGILPDEIRLRPKTPMTQDLVPLHASTGRWHPARVDGPEERLKAFVDWELLISYLQESCNESLYLHLRPISLSRWLKNRY